MRPDHAILIEQGQPTLGLEHALDHEHHVGAAGIVFVEGDRKRSLQRPRQDAFTEFRDLLSFLEDDRILADEIDTADVAVEIDADHRPVEARRHLLDVGRLAGAVIALDHHAAVVGKAREDRERRVAIEAIGRIEVRNVFVAVLERRNLHVRRDPECLCNVDSRVGFQGGIETARHFFVRHNLFDPVQASEAEETAA